MGGLRVTITCEECGERHPLEKRRYHSEDITILCHNCELPITAHLEMEDMEEPAEDATPFPREQILPPGWYSTWEQGSKLIR
jgi:hypothetical protein